MKNNKALILEKLTEDMEKLSEKEKKIITMYTLHNKLENDEWDRYNQQYCKYSDRSVLPLKKYLNGEENKVYLHYSRKLTSLKRKLREEY